MRFRKKSVNNNEMELNVTSLVDIVLVLLIFFMVTTNFNKITNLTLRLPEVTKEFNKEAISGLTLTVTKQGKYYLNDLPVEQSTKQSLISAITDLAHDNRELSFVISGDGEAPHQAVVTALEAAGELGFSNIRLAAVKNS